MGGEVREDRLQQPLDRTGLGGESRHPGNIQMRGLGSHQKIGVEEDRRPHATSPVHTHRNTGGRFPRDVAIHAERHRDIGVVGEIHGPERHGLQRFLGDVPQHRRRIQPDFGAIGVRHRPRVRTAIVAEHIVQRRLKIAVAEPFHHHAVHARDHVLHRRVALHAHDGADPDGRIDRGPEVKLVRRIGLFLGRDDTTERQRQSIGNSGRRGHSVTTKKVRGRQAHRDTSHRHECRR